MAARHPQAAASTGALVAVAFGAVGAALCFRNGVGGLGVSVFTMAVSVALVATGMVVRRQAVGALVVTLTLGGIWGLRASTWVRVPVGTCLALCLLASVFFGRRGDVFDSRWRNVLRSPSALAGHAVLTPRWLGRSLGDRVRLPATVSYRVLGRALLLAFPVLVLLLLLLISADPVFASLVHGLVDPSRWVTTVVALVVGGGVVSLLARIACCEPAAGQEPSSPARHGAVDALVVLAGMTLLLAAFVGVQVATTLGFGRALLAERGITYSSYARSGYFQLLWVVGISVTVLIVVDALLGTARRALVTALSLTVVVLDLAIGLSAVRRLDLYDHAYGLTMLRLTCLFGAVFMGAILALVGVWTAGVRRRRHWLPGALAVALIVVVGLFGSVNPEGLVAHADLARVGAVPPDLHYLAGLSADAVPSLVAGLPALDASERSTLRAALCSRTRSSVGWAQQSISSMSSTRELDELCGSVG